MWSQIRSGKNYADSDPLHYCLVKNSVEDPIGSGSRILAQFGSGSRVILSILKEKIQNNFNEN